MEYIYATLTLDELDSEINETNLTAVLEAAGADVSPSRVKAIVAALEDVDVGDLAPPDERASGDDDAGTDESSGDTKEETTDDGDTPTSEGGSDDGGAVTSQHDDEV